MVFASPDRKLVIRSGGAARPSSCGGHVRMAVYQRGKHETATLMGDRGIDGYIPRDMAGCHGLIRNHRQLHAAGMRKYVAGQLIHQIKDKSMKIIRWFLQHNDMIAVSTIGIISIAILGIAYVVVSLLIT